MMGKAGIPGTVETEATPPAYTMSPDSDEIPLSDIVRAFRRYGLTLALVVVACTGAVLLTAYLVPKRYTATTTVSLVPQSSATDEGEIASISKNIAAIASVSYNSDPKKIESLVKLQSSMLLERYITKNNLIPVLFGQERVSLTDATDYFDKSIRKVISDPLTGFVELTITWKDPVVATEWADGLVAMANDIDREAAEAASQRTIGYLADQASKTDEVAIRRNLNSLIAAELKKSLVAQGTREFSFKVIDPAVVPEKYSYPNQLTWLVTAFFGSLSMALFVLFCLVAWRKAGDSGRSRGA